MTALSYTHICDYLAHWASVTPNDEAVVFASERLSWAQLNAQVESLACQLISMGVEKGDRVAMLSAARNEYMVTYLATLMVGGIWYGLHPRYQPQEIKYMLQDAGAKVVITVDSYLDRVFQDDFNDVLPECESVEQLLVIGGSNWSSDENWKCSQWALNTPSDDQLRQLQERSESRNADDGAVIVFTSGTTGKPKGALLTHKNILSCIGAQNTHFSLVQTSVVLIHFPINHIACSTELTIGSLLVGAKIIFLDKFHPVETLETVQKEKISIFGQIPTMFLMEFALPNYDDYDLSSVKTYVWSGSSAPESMVQRLQKTGASLVTGYGMTELTGFVTYSPNNAMDDELMKAAGIIDPAFELKLVDDQRVDLDHEQISAGEIGEIAVKGDCVMAGYWGKPKQTAEVMGPDGWFFTGDMARLDGRGNIYLAGRGKDMFISGGFNIYPREIEAVIEQFDGVAMASVIPVQDPVYQEVGKVLILPKEGEEISLEKIKLLCRNELANFKVPKFFEQVDSFPLLPNGKLDKKAIVAQYK